MFSLICVWINDWVNNGEAGDLRRYRIHYDVIVMGYLVKSTHLVLAKSNWPFIPTICNHVKPHNDHVMLTLSVPYMQIVVLQCNVVSHWLGAYIFWSLYDISNTKATTEAEYLSALKRPNYGMSIVGILNITEAEMSFWRHIHCWLHQNTSLWQRIAFDNFWCN